MRAFWRWMLVVVLLGGIGLAAALGWIAPALALDAAMGAVALVGLFALLSLPWDLYFQARGLVIDQRESVSRGIEVAPDERAAALRLSRRLALLCVGLHVGAAGLLALASLATGGRIGFAFAGFYLVSMIFRPIETAYRHLASRLSGLRERVRYPRDDVMRWVDTVRQLEAEAEAQALRLTGIDERIAGLRAELLEALRESDERGREHDRALDRKLDRVLVELDRTVDRLGADRELVAGLRALAKLLRGESVA